MPPQAGARDGPGWTSSDRQAGLSVAFLLIVVSVLHPDLPVPSNWLPSAGALIFIIALARPALLRPLAITWRRMTGVVGALVSWGVLGFLYLFVLTPLGLFGRVTGRLHFEQLPSSVKSTYWRKREDGSIRFGRQF